MADGSARRQGKPRRTKKGDKARSTVAAGGGVLDVHAADEPPTNSHEVAETHTW